MVIVQTYLAGTFLPCVQYMCPLTVLSAGGGGGGGNGCTDHYINITSTQKAVGLPLRFPLIPHSLPLLLAS